MELRPLRYFVAVAEHGGFSKTARALYISQSAISDQISGLEEELGVSLFHRTGARVQLTPHGELFLVEARKVLDAAAHAVDVAQRSARGDLGDLRLAFFAGGVGSQFPRLIRSYRQSHPNIRVSLTEMIVTRQWEAIARGEIDLGFTRRLEPPYDRLLRSEPLRQDPLRVILPKTHRFATGDLIDLTQLAKERFVLCARETSPVLYDRIFELCAESGFSPIVANISSVWSSIVMLVQAGEGIALLPSNLQELATKDLAFCPVRGNPSIDLVMTWSPNRETPILHDFLKLVRTNKQRV